jgi:nitroimidazol reductase NimA-like FMN-containing flavoprotein (pyridoxamine 5'-phosphate oxidase superfamily)
MFNKFMNEQILNFIKSKRVGVLAVQMPDGSPHAATIHFAYEEEPLVFLFETSPETKKS